MLKTFPLLRIECVRAIQFLFVRTLTNVSDINIHKVVYLSCDFFSWKAVSVVIYYYATN